MMPEGNLINAWNYAIGEPTVVDVIDQIHTDARREIEERKPLCVASGECCKFDAYGHRMFVTGVEAALTLSRVDQSLMPEEIDRTRNGCSCPFQTGCLCAIHTRRPLACRLFFCDTSAESWMPDLSQRLHDRLRSLHDLWSIPYRYIEWRDLLAMFAAHHPR